MSVEVCAATAKVLSPCFLPCIIPIQDECARGMESFVNLDINLRSLVNAERNLKDKAESVKTGVESETNQDQSLQPTHGVTRWLDGVREALNKSPQRADYAGLERCACCWCCCNVVLSSDCQLHRKVKEKLDKVNELMEQGNNLQFPYTKIRPLDVAANRSYPPLIFVNMEHHLDKLWSKLGDSTNKVIGVYGPGGVGKTTLLKEFKKQLESNEEYSDAVVIFIEVSNSGGTFNIAHMQKQMISQLDCGWNESQEERERAALLLNVLCGKKFVVLLDAVWKSLQLEKVGIPYPDKSSNSKLIVASRSEKVCTEMQAMSAIKMEGLNEEDAMDLFLSNLKQGLRNAIDRNNALRSCVKNIVGRCSGLPLALNVLGSAFACVQYHKELEDAASEMFDHSKLNDFEHMLDILEASYNELDKATKSCFLNCVLFPDYGSIDIQLLEDYWVAEGLISWSSTSPHAGNLFIGNLISACLLQKSEAEPESEVKMHFMIREMGIRLAKKHNYVIEASRGLTEAPAAEEWTKATRISLMSNNFNDLSISPECPELETLLLQNNPSLGKLGSSLFRRMPQLKVLDLSHTAIDKLPDCIALRQLAYLNLSHTNIKEFPGDICNKLRKLLYLNMSHTRFTRLPRNLPKLKLLRHLNLSETSALKKIPNGTISKLFALRVLNLYKSHYGILEQPDLNLENLKQLHTLGITIHSKEVLDKLSNNELLAKCTRFLSLSDCKGMQSIQISKFGKMQKLEELNIESCNELKSMDADIGENKVSGDSMKVLNKRILPDLHEVVVPAVGHQFRSLRHLAIHACHKLVNVSWVLQLHSLERLEISNCRELEEIAQEMSNGTNSMASTSGEPPEEINAAAATSTNNSNLQGPDSSSCQNDANRQEQDASLSQTSSGEPQEEMNAAAASTTITSSSNLQGRDASSKNGGLETIEQQQSNKMKMNAEGANIGNTQEVNNCPTFTDANGQEQDASSSQNVELNEIVQEQSNRAAPSKSIVSEIQEEIDHTPSIQVNSEAFASPSMVRKERTGTTSLTSDVRVNQQDNAIRYGVANLQQTHPFDRLRIIVLKDLSKLKSIYTTRDFPCLTTIKVLACPNLGKLPVGGMPKLKQIHAERDWWDRLPLEIKNHWSKPTLILS